MISGVPAFHFFKGEKMVMADIRQFENNWRVATFEVDAQSEMKLSTMLRICQETSEKHLAALGIGYEKLKADGMVFLITKSESTIKRMPAHTEELRIVTKPQGVRGAEFYRDYEFFVGEESIAYVMQCSVAANTQTHRIMHPRKFERYGIDASANGVTEHILSRIKTEGLPFLGERQIQYSDLDYNGHLNNAIYGDIFYDFVPEGMMGKKLEKIQINFVNESLLGETIRIFGEEKGGKVILYGENSRGRAFEASAELTQREQQG